MTQKWSNLGRKMIVLIQNKTNIFIMKTYTKARPVREINGVSPARHIKASKKQFEQVIEPCTLDGVILDETYLKANKKVFRNKQRNYLF